MENMEGQQAGRIHADSKTLTHLATQHTCGLIEVPSQRSTEHKEMRPEIVVLGWNKTIQGSGWPQNHISSIIFQEK